MRSWPWLTVLAIPLVLATQASAQVPEGWEIVEIFPAGTEYHCGPPDINDRGQIVFHRRLWPTRNGIEVMLYDRGKVIQLSDDDVYDSFPRLNNYGVVVWSKDLDPNPRVERIGIVRWTQGDVRIISDPGDEYWGEGPSDINDAGQIVWERVSRSPGSEVQLVHFNGTVVCPITNNSFSNQGARINNQGDLVWAQYDNSLSPWKSDIVAAFQGLSTTLTIDQHQVQGPHLNDLRQVVWAGLSSGLELWYEGKTVTVLESNAYRPEINNVGQIAVSRWDVVHKEAQLWLVDEGAARQLMDGSMGGNIPAINNRGQIAIEFGRFPLYGIALFTKKSFAADLDFDADVDLVDFGLLQQCFEGELPFSNDLCSSGDINCDGHINNQDFLKFTKYFTGPEVRETCESKQRMIP